MTFNSIIRKTGSALFTIGILGCFLDLGVGYLRIASNPEDKVKFNSAPVINRGTHESKVDMLAQKAPFSSENSSFPVNAALAGGLLMLVSKKKKQK